jgi:hypothetical protein
MCWWPFLTDSIMQMHFRLVLLVLACLTIFICCSSCNSGYQQNISGISGAKFCLDIQKTKEENDIPVGNGTLTLNADKTFTILNDSSKFTNLTGHWDLCCVGSDWGNYVFKVDGLDEWKQADPNLFVVVDNKKVRLFFSSCDKKN